MTKPTNLGRTFPLVNSSALGGSSGSISGTAADGTYPGSGQVPTSSGSNTWAWSSNVALITSNTSNALLGPFVNLASGTGTTFAVASNTLTISSSGGAGASTTFDDLGWFNVEDYGAVHDGATDDTSAIQAAIDACSTAGGGTVYFPPGTYQVSGALRDTGTFNSQLEIPDSSTFRQIRLLGAAKYTSVIRSDWSGTISGTPAIISCGTHDSTTQNALYLVLENLSIRGINDPKLTAVDATKAITVRYDELLIGVTSWPPTLPTHSNAVGLDCPWGLNDGHTGGPLLQVEGYYTALRPSEQFSGTALWAAYCARVIEFRGQQGTPAFLRHACRIGRVEGYFSLRGVVFSGDERWVWIDQLCMEHGDPSFNTVYDIDDASNYGRGFIGWHTTDYSTGVADDLLVNGGTGLSLFGAYAKRWKLNSVVDIPTGTNPSGNPSNGRRLYADSADGHLSARDSSGNVIDYETDISGVTVSGTPSAGQVLTATSASAATWDDPTGGSAAYLVIADSHSMPLVFADIVQNEAGDDFIYTG